FRGIRDDSEVSLTVPWGDVKAFNSAYQRVEREAGVALPLRNLGLLRVHEQMVSEAMACRR
ncbi:MAG: hypothetical protein GTN78_17790, partial [Gemmatimonadales bacterium]|nr:hypothetical protein [Gemmatimonadales bacterium]